MSCDLASYLDQSYCYWNQTDFRKESLVLEQLVSNERPGRNRSPFVTVHVSPAPVCNSVHGVCRRLHACMCGR